jgi:hypothetical protein
MENAFSNMNSAFSTATRPYKQHQSELPPPPDSFKKMLNHTLSAEFKAAAKAKWALAWLLNGFRRLKCLRMA